VITWIKRRLGGMVLRAQGWAVFYPPETRDLRAWRGADGILELLESSSGVEAVRILVRGGAKIGQDGRIHRGLTLYNVETDFTNLTIGHSCHVGRQVFLDLAAPVCIGDRVTISMRCTVLTHTDPGSSKSEAARRLMGRSEVVIEDDAYLGASVVVLPGVRIGSGCVVGAGAVVTRDVAPGETVVGAPARPLVSKGGRLERTHPR